MSSEKVVKPFHNLLPLCACRHSLPSSVMSHIPKHGAQQSFRLDQFSSTAAIGHCVNHCRFLQSACPRCHLVHGLCGVRPPTLQRTTQRTDCRRQLTHVGSLSSADLVGVFCGARGVTHGRTHGTVGSAGCHSVIHFPFGPRTRLSAIVCTASRMRFLCSRGMPTSRGSTHVGMCMINSILGDGKDEFPLPCSSALACLIDSVAGFISEAPHFIQGVIAHSTRTGTDMGFCFPGGDFHVSRAVSMGQRKIGRMRGLALTLVASPMCVVSDLALLTASSPRNG